MNRDPAFGAITAEQQARITADEREVARRRLAAHYSSITENRRPVDPDPTLAPEWHEHNCAACDHAGDFNDEHRRAYCMWLKQMVSTWHPAICGAFVPLARPKRIKVEWKGVVYG